MRFATLVLRLIRYFFVFIFELIVANLQVAKIVLSPRLNFKSGAVKYKSKMKNEWELILITNSITLTPGTLVMDATLKSGEIFVHVMSGETTEHMKESLEKFPEKEVLRATRGGEPS